MFYRMLRQILLVLLLAAPLCASATKGAEGGEWKDADQLRRERQVALLSDTNQACRLNGQRPSRLQPVSNGKPAKPSWRLSQMFCQSTLYICQALSAFISKAEKRLCVSLRYDFIALRHIIR